MSGISSSYPSGSEHIKPPVHPSRRRDKQQLSCVTCRHKKLKCDRQQPCGNCAKRSRSIDSIPCKYVQPGASQLSSSGIKRPSNTTQVQARVLHLEELVLSLMKKSSRSPAGSATVTENSIGEFALAQDAQIVSIRRKPEDTMTNNAGRLIRDNTGVSYIGDARWESVLEEITELKGHFDESNDGVEDQITETGDVDFEPRILFGANNHASRSDIMSSIPTRPICDRLLSRYFNSIDSTPMAIHTPSFLKEYDRFWSDHDTAPLMWIGLLYALLGLGSHFYILSGDDMFDITPAFLTSPQDMVTLYRDRTAQCLVSVNYLRPEPFTLQTLLLYSGLELLRSGDVAFESWIILGLVVRVSMRLGYHRDPRHYPSISVFHGEMRRRTWAAIQHLDLFTSSQVGLPRMIREDEADTAEPRNLLDTDFDEDTTELPTSRPSTDGTPLTYTMHKTSLLTVLGAIFDQTNSIKPFSYDAILSLDSRLQDRYNSVPPGLNARSVRSSITDNPDIIIRRLILHSWFQKGRCILHRKYLIPAHSGKKFIYSRKSCVDAAMKLLDIQAEFHNSSQPGGLLFRDRWKMGTPVNNDFLLAAMILCLDLDSKTDNNNHCEQQNQEDEVEESWPRSMRLEAVNHSYEIWCATSRTSMLAAKAAELLGIMLKKLNMKSTNRNESAPSAGASWPTTRSSDSDTIIRTGTMESPPIKFTPNQSKSVEGTFPLFSGQYISHSTTSEFVLDMMDSQMDFDWNLWDTHFQANASMPNTEGLEDFNSFGFEG